MVWVLYKSMANYCFNPVAVEEMHLYKISQLQLNSLEMADELSRHWFLEDARDKDET